MKVSSRQSLFDLSMQHGGSFEAAFDIAEGNDLSLTDDLEVGQELILQQVNNTKVVQYYDVNNIQPATSVTNDELNAMLGMGEGIEFWAIEYDFIVS